jgi:hypothetical protein
MGCTSPPCGVDSCRCAAHCHYVWFGGYANAVSETTARKRASTKLLRDQRSRLAQRVGPVRMYGAHTEKKRAVASAPDCDHSSSTGSGSDGPIATPPFVRSEASSDRRDLHKEPSRFPDASSAMSGEWGQQAFHRTTVSTGNRNDIWEMAAAASADARNAPVSRRREGDSRCLGLRLQYAERFHFHV